MIGGLKEKIEDPNIFKVGAVFDLPALSELPEEFTISLPRVLDQGDTDFCTAAASGILTEAHEGVELAWPWVFAVGKLLEGEGPDTFGLQLQTVCKVLCKFGIPEVADLPPGFLNQSPEILRRIENWDPELYNKALKHQQGSYISVEGVFDTFDDIRATIWKFRNDKSGVMLGVMWSWALSQVIMEVDGQGQFGHAMVNVGWRVRDGKTYLYIQGSSGESAGENGRHYFSREVINNNVKKFGAYLIHDLKKEDVEQIIRDRQGLQLSLLKWILLKLKTYYNNIIK